MDSDPVNGMDDIMYVLYSKGSHAPALTFPTHAQ